MANPNHLAILSQGAKAWNEWRRSHPEIAPDLSGADLRDVGGHEPLNFHGAQLQSADLTHAGIGGADFGVANLRDADMTGTLIGVANFQGADLRGARLVGASFRVLTVRTEGSFCQTNCLTSKALVNGVDIMKSAQVVRASGSDFGGADLRDADMRESKLNGAHFVLANLTGADLRDADISDADLTDADLTNANLQCALLVNTKVHRTKFNGAFVYGISAWNLDFEQTEQSNLVVTPSGEQTITVDNLEVAQFVYLLVKNPRIRDVINTVGQKSVLILGRFGERKNVLDAIREALRQHDYIPIVFDFERPDDRDFTETVMTLAGMSRFIVADITEPRSVPLELQAAVPNFMIPFVPLIQEGEAPFAMFWDLRRKYRDWVLEPVAYPSIEALVQVFDKFVIEPANETLRLLQARKAEPQGIKSVREIVSSTPESSGPSDRITG